MQNSPVTAARLSPIKSAFRLVDECKLCMDTVSLLIRENILVHIFSCKLTGKLFSVGNFLYLFFSVSKEKALFHYVVIVVYLPKLEVYSTLDLDPIQDHTKVLNISLGC